jgi:hypothetical protein
MSHEVALSAADHHRLIDKGGDEAGELVAFLARQEQHFELSLVHFEAI